MTADASAITARGLTKRYGSTIAVDGLDLDVPRGDVYAFWAPTPRSPRRCGS